MLKIQCPHCQNQFELQAENESISQCTCPKCHATVTLDNANPESSQNSTTCPHCQQPVTADMKFCPHCGATIVADANAKETKRLYELAQNAFNEAKYAAAQDYIHAALTQQPDQPAYRELSVRIDATLKEQEMQREAQRRQRYVDAVRADAQGEFQTANEWMEELLKEDPENATYLELYQQIQKHLHGEDLPKIAPKKGKSTSTQPPKTSPQPSSATTPPPPFFTMRNVIISALLLLAIIGVGAYTILKQRQAVKEEHQQEMVNDSVKSDSLQIH